MICLTVINATQFTGQVYPQSLVDFLTTFLQLLVLHLEGIELLHKSHVFAAARSRHQAVHLEEDQQPSGSNRSMVQDN